MEREEYLSPKITKTVRGLLCLLIIFHHLYQYRLSIYIPSTIGAVFQNLGFWCVAIFFFQSGYQLSYSKDSKVGYINNFLIKKVTPLFVSFTIFLIIYIVYYMISKNYQLSSLWYFCSIIYLYLLFYISNQNSNRIILKYLIGIVVYIVICMILGFPINYYATILCFLLGVIWHKYYFDIKKFISRNSILLLVLNMIIFIAFFLSSKTFLLSIMPLSNIVFMFSNVLLVTLFLQLNRIIYFENTYLIKLGNYSLEVYSIQFIFYRLFENTNIYIFIFLSIILTIIFAIIINKTTNLIINAMNRRSVIKND